MSADKFRNFNQGLPRPQNYGYMRADDPVPIINQDEVRFSNLRVKSPEQVFRQGEQAIPDIQSPPISQIVYGAGDPQVVGLLLNVIKNGAADPASGATPELASYFLTKWGYPTDMSALDAPGWEAAIAKHALDPNPMMLLGG